MSKKTTSFLFKEEYQKWLLKNGINTNSLGAYCPQDKYDDKFLF